MKHFLLLIIILMASSTLASAQFDIQGHRGARGLKPENTLSAFEIALDLGVTTLEMDLHFTADEVVVVWHDPYISSDKCRLDANADGIAPDPENYAPEDEMLLISQLTFEQVQAYRCDRNPDLDRFPDQDHTPTSLAGDNYRIASLANIFDFVATYANSEDKSPEQRENAMQIQFNIETKRDPNKPFTINDNFDGENAGAFELAILALVEEQDLVDRVIIQSFDHRSLYAIRTEHESIRLAALTSRGAPPFAEFVEYNITIWSPFYLTLTPPVMNRLADETGSIANFQVIPWTVNDPCAMRDMMAMGVDGLITDHPDIFFSLVQDAEGTTLVSELSLQEIEEGLSILC